MLTKKSSSLVLFLCVLMSGLIGRRVSHAESPNVVIFLTDDQGWGDLGCQGHPSIRSPHLDRFATQGVRFRQCYSACGVCSPSRSAILTGRTPYRNDIVKHWDDFTVFLNPLAELRSRVE